MITFAINLSAHDAERLRVVAARTNSTPEAALLAQVQVWIEAEAPDVLEPGISPAPLGMFPDDGSKHYFFDPRDADPGQAEDFLTPEQRFDMVAEILATIALRVMKKEQEQKSVACGGTPHEVTLTEGEDGDGASGLDEGAQEEVAKKTKRRAKRRGRGE